ncbi:hypothetical protein D048_1406 [Vibrio parahaemolyticus VPTS-2009]|nr:hypothetical protein D048_1406 [Vibrio parahaemolyticus VPTS-2009]
MDLPCILEGGYRILAYTNAFVFTIKPATVLERDVCFG